jgi:hypothetical protein
MKQIFLSYARDDYPFAHRLVGALRDVGVTGWMDNADIAAGTALGEAMRSAIKNSSAVVVLVSPTSLKSRWVEFEIGAGLALGKQMIPIVVEGDWAALPEPLRNLQVLDARNKHPEEVARDLTRVLSDT